MLSSIKETTTGIMQELYLTGTHKVPNNSIFINIPVRYARKSATDLTEEKDEIYPQIVMYDYVPEFDTDWTTNYKKIVDDFHSFTTTRLNPNLVPTKAYLFDEPLRLIFKYDFTFYVTDPMHRYSVLDYMLRKYKAKGVFVLNKVTLPEGDVGDFLEYSLIFSENTRTDGVFEMNYEFTFKAFVNVSDAEEVNLISSFVITPTVLPLT